MREYVPMLLAGLICGGVIAAISAVKTRLLSPVKSGRNAELCALVWARRDAEGLEETVRGLERLSETGRAVMPVLIVLSEPTEEARLRAERLARRAGGTVCEAENTEEKLREVLWTRETKE